MFLPIPIVSIVKDLIYYIYVLSFKTGEFLVTLLKLITSQFITIVNSVITLVSILNESFAVFLSDIIHGIQTALHAVYNIGEIFFNIYAFGCNGLFFVVNGITNFYNVIINTLTGCALSVLQLFVLIKKLIILFGSGVWFAITIVPLFIFYCGTMFVYFLGRLMEEIGDAVVTVYQLTQSWALNVFDFIFDVPIESLAGLLTVISISYILMEFYVIITAYLRDNTLFIYHSVKRIFNRFVQKILQMISNANFTRRSIPSANTNPPLVNRSPDIRRGKLKARPHIRSGTPAEQSDQDNLNGCCVICEEQRKCILLLPCKHVCMCYGCSQRLRYYNNKCPICRTHIENSMKIFI